MRPTSLSMVEKRASGAEIPLYRRTTQRSHERHAAEVLGSTLALLWARQRDHPSPIQGSAP